MKSDEGLLNYVDHHLITAGILKANGIEQQIIDRLLRYDGNLCLRTQDNENAYLMLEGKTTPEILLILKMVQENEVKDIPRIINKTKRYEVLKRQDWSCNTCGCRLKFSNKQSWDAPVAHIDHIHPWSKRQAYLNGAQNINELSNLQALCPDCNNKKSDKEIH